LSIACPFPFTVAPAPTTTSPSMTTSPSTSPKISRLPPPRTFPRTVVSPPSVEPPRMAASHLHVDVALERGSVCDRQARGTNVADEPPARLNVDAIDRGHIARELARDAHRLRR